VVLINGIRKIKGEKPHMLLERSWSEKNRRDPPACETKEREG